LPPDDFNSLLQEAESLWRTAPCGSSEALRLDDLVSEIYNAISTATENSQISRAEGLLPWYERLSQLRLEAARTIEDLDEDDRTRTYQGSKALSLARIAIELSSGDARDHWQRATQYIVEAESIVSGEKKPNKVMIKLLSEARANLFANELRDLPWNDALKSVEKIDYPPYQHWALHRLGLHLAASGDIDHACEVLRRMSELEGQGRLSKTPDQWAELAELQAGIAAAALAVGQPLLFEQMNFSFEASLLEAKSDEEWVSDRLKEAAFRCRRLLANASIQSREVLKALITVTRGLRSVRQHSQASWRGESWYDLHWWLTWMCEELLERGPWGRRLARMLTDWQVEHLSLIEEQGPREDRAAWLAFLYGVLDAIPEQRELLGRSNQKSCESIRHRFLRHVKRQKVILLGHGRRLKTSVHGQMRWIPIIKIHGCGD
jgi:hypothetical protein